jgi:hypothetical protein
MVAVKILADYELRRKFYTGFLGLLVWLVLTACGPTSQITPSPSTTSDEDNIRELILRYRFQHDIGGLTPQGKIYFIAFTSGSPGSTQRKDPDGEFLKRFQGNNPPVKKVSEAEIVADAVKDKTTGEPGTIFGVGEIHRISPDEVEVEGNWYEAGMNQGGNTFRVVRENKQWTIKGTKGGWIT